VNIGDVNFPESLLAARKEARLVVFAGAGVSVPPPSNYPNFKNLAIEVSGGRLALAEDQPIDQFLGQLNDLKVQVHRLVREILDNPQSKPNSLHFDLLRLFDSTETLRLVTTNFDQHFSSAAATVFGEPNACEIHSAPALPLGHSFSGIVYLHGSVTKPADRLVLTDSDFGRAYLTEGWARLFLQRIFETYTVLFVGYSHNDPVMNYIARGFTPEMGTSRRFALVLSGENEDLWTYRGVIPITYRAGDGGNLHSILPKAIAAWARQSRLGMLEKEGRIRTLVGSPPPIDLEDSDFILDSFADVSTARFFTQHADSIKWLKWVEEKKLLKRLFEPRSVLTEVDATLAWWIAQKFLCQHPSETFSLLRRQGQMLNPYFWGVLTQNLSLNWPKIDDRTALRRWVTSLVSLHSPATRAEPLEHLAQHFVFPEDAEVAVLVFEYLSRPLLRLKHDLWGELDESNPRENVTFELDSRGGGFWLDHLWVRFFEPNLNELCDRIEPIIRAHLQLAYLIYQSGKTPDRTWDTLSLSRNQIEERDHGRQQGALGVLVDAAMDVVKWNAVHRPSRSDAIVETWFSADSFLLKRLALLAISMSDHWSADKKLGWLLENDLLYELRLKHEVFTILKAAYPLGSTKSKTATVERAKIGRPPNPEVAEHTAQYEIFNLVAWLHNSDPGCSIANAVFDAMQTDHPEFRVREHPDLDITFSPLQIGLQSPIGVTELLSNPPGKQIDFLNSYDGASPVGPSRDGLTQSVTAAVIGNYQWSRDLASALEQQIAPKIDLWSALVQGWSGSELASDAWKDVLTLLNARTELHVPISGEIARLLEEGVKRNSHPIPSDCFAIADNLSEQIWDGLKDRDDRPKSVSKSPDWVMRAINHPAGTLTLFWLRLLARQRREQGAEWKGISDKVKGKFARILIDSGYSAELSRVLLASVKSPV
jgi:hypothetical protein